MATFIAATAFDMTDFISNGSLGELFNFGEVVTGTSDTFTLDYVDELKSERLTLLGTFADYVDGFPTSGTITDAAYSLNGSPLFNLTGVSMPASQFTTFVQADDILGLFQALLAGADQVTGSAGDDVLFAYEGNDSINGGGGNDLLDGGDGNDVIDGGAGRDQLAGGAGDDTLVVSTPPIAGELFDGGEGVDTLDVRVSAGFVANTAFGPISRVNFGATTLSSIERIQFGSTAETSIAVSVRFDQIGAGLSGTAELVGSAGHDQINVIATVAGTYTAPTFTYSNWEGNVDPLAFADQLALIAGGPGDFTLNASEGHAGTQILAGGAGNDVLNGTDGSELLTGGAGVNMLNAGGGTDLLIAANVTPFGGATTNLTYQGNVFDGGDGFDRLSVGGFVNFQGTLVSIEGIHFQPAFTATMPGTQSQQGAELEIDVANLPVDLSLSGQGVLSVNVTNGIGYDASQWLHEAGSNVAVEFFGTSASESFVGTSGNDRFSGGFGSDLFTGGAGSDQFEAGDGQHVATDFTIGEDRVDLQDMNFTSFDQLLPYLSQVGADVVFSRLFGGVAQTMTLRNVALGDLTAASFVFQTGNDDDTRIGTDQADELFGAFGNDTLEGQAGDDYLFAGAGNDTLRGGLGNDRLYGGAGNDFLSEASGDNGPFGNDLYDGGDGVDRVSLFTAFGPGVTVDLRLDTAQNTGSMGTDTFVGIEHITSNHGDDTLIGNDATNWFWTFSGTDNLSGNGGDDYFTVGKGDKIVDGGSGVDTIDIFDTAFEPAYTAAGITVSLALQGSAQATGTGNWTLTGIENLGGSFGADRLTGDSNANVLAGAEGDDTLIGGDGDDILSGDGAFDIDENGVPALFDDITAPDWLFGNDVLEGGAGNDTLTGAAGNDTLRGGLGNDRLFGGLGNDFLTEGSGDTGPFGDDLYDGGDGSDRVSLFTDFGPGATVDLRLTTAQNTGMGNDAFVGIEHITATYNNDTLTGNDAANWFWTFNGHDVLAGNGGDDLFTVGLGEKVVDGGAGVDTVEVSDMAYQPLYTADGITVSLALQGTAQATGIGNWTLANVENLSGFYGSDDFTGDANANFLAGAEGDDTLRGGDGNDTLSGDGTFGLNTDGELDFFEDGALENWAFGNDVLEGGAGDDTLNGGRGNDTLRGGLGNDRLYGGDGDDFLSEASGDNGPFGDDLYDGGAGSDRVSMFTAFGPGITVDLRLETAQNTGSMGTDTFVGIEHITANYGDDTLIGNDADNWFWTFSGTDNLTGNGGNDYFTVGSGDKVADGGTGIDTIEIAEFAFTPVYTADGITVSLALQGSAQVTGAGTWTITNFENLGGFNGSDELTGDDNANILAGGLGGDTLVGGGGNDTLAGDGTFIFQDGAQQFVENNTVDGPGGNDVLEGGAGDDRLVGGGGDDVLDGGEGNDFMVGGTGNDVYVAGLGDGLVEEADGGIDEVRTDLDWGLGDHLEKLTATGTANVFLGGNALDNALTGNSGDNYLAGEGGNDMIDGGAGRDIAAFRLPASTIGTLRVVEGPDGALLVQLVQADDSFEDLFSVAPGAAGSATVTGLGSMAGFGTDTVANIEDLHFLVDTWPEPTPAGQFVAIPLAVVQHEGYVAGSAGDDVIDLADYPGATNVGGGFGDDSITGGSGADYIRGDAGNDLIDGGGNDQAGFDVAAYGLPAGTTGSLRVVAGTGTHAGSLVVERVDGDTVEALFIVSFTEAGVASVQGVNSAAFLGTDIVTNVNAIDFTVDNPEFDPAQFAHIIVPRGTTTGSDALFGGGASDAMFGGDGHDFLRGNAGDDLVYAGNGDDFLVGGAGNDLLDGGAGIDRVAYGGAAAGVTVDLGLEGVAQATGMGLDTLVGIEHVTGGSFDDLLTGNAGDNWLWGITGNDTISGGDGDDLAEIGSGNSTVDGGAGNDTLLTNNNVAGAVTIALALQGAAQDSGQGMMTLSGLENLSGSQFNDQLSGDDAANILGGDEGDDWLIGGGGDDMLYGDGGIGIDSHDLGGSGPIQWIEDGAVFAIPGGNDTLEGGAGDDRLVGGGGGDVLDGGEGNDTLRGGSGGDVLHGGAGNDVFDYSFGANGIDGDTITELDVGDVIDLRSNGLDAGGPVLCTTFIGASAFSGAAGEYRYQISGTQTLVEVDSDGDGIADSVLTIANGAFILSETTPGSNMLGLGAEIDPLAGIVADGYVEGATLFVDTNGNKQLDSGEAWTVTGPGGIFSLNVNQAGTIVALGGVNADTGLANTMTLIAPSSSGVVNPLTTLITAVVDAGAGATSLAEAEAQVKQALGLDPTLDLLNLDLLGQGSDPAALAAQKAAAMIANLVSTTEAVPGAGSGSEATVVGALAQLVGGNATVDLTSAATLTDLLTEALPGVPDIGAIANEVSSDGQKIAAATSIADVSKAQVEAQFTGNSLNNVISGNEGGNVLSGLGGDDTLLGLDGNDTLIGGAGQDNLTGGSGADIFSGSLADLNGDTIADFKVGDRIVISDASAANFAFTYANGMLSFGGSSVSLLGVHPGANLLVSAAAGGGVELAIQPQFGGTALITTAFGSGPAAGGWSTNDQYPREMADVNGDGRADIVGFGNDGVYVALGTVDGAFANPVLATTAFGAAAGAGGWSSDDRYPRQLADVNGDGRDDVVGFGNDGVYVSLAAANGTFGAPILATTAFGAAPGAGGWASDDQYPRHLADVNGDGRADVVGFGNDGVYVSLAAVDGTFAAPILATTAFGAGASAGGWSSQDAYARQLADVNGDGRADIVGFGNSGAYVSIASADGSFAAPILGLDEFGASAEAGGWSSDDRNPRMLGDINGDGKMDIVGFGGEGVFIALGKGNGTFEKTMLDLGFFGADPAAGGWDSADIFPRHLADVNHDGAADIVGFASTGVYVAFSNGDIWL